MFFSIDMDGWERSPRLLMLLAVVMLPGAATTQNGEAAIQSLNHDLGHEVAKLDKFKEDVTALSREIDSLGSGLNETHAALDKAERKRKSIQDTNVKTIADLEADNLERLYAINEQVTMAEELEEKIISTEAVYMQHIAELEERKDQLLQMQDERKRDLDALAKEMNHMKRLNQQLGAEIRELEHAESGTASLGTSADWPAAGDYTTLYSPQWPRNGGGSKSKELKVMFKRAYARVPTVWLGSISKMESSHKQRTRYWLEVADTSTTGFTLRATAWHHGHTQFYSVDVDWFSHSTLLRH